MCGRYYIDDDVEEEISHVLQETDGKLRLERKGDICPSNAAPVIYGRNDRLCGMIMKWRQAIPSPAAQTGL